MVVYDYMHGPVATDDEVKEVKYAIIACIAAHKGGLPISSLQDAYERMNGEEIPYLKIGYNSLFHLLRDMPQIKSVRTSKHDHALTVVQNQRISHIQKLVNKQRDPKINRNSMRENQKKKEKSDRNQYFDQYRHWNSSSNSSNGEMSKDQVIKPDEDENWGRPIITNISGLNDDLTATPVLGNFQLIGDDYFLQLAMKYTNAKFVREDGDKAVTCGTVQSGLTIKRASKRLEKVKTMANKLMINVGTVDVHRRKTSDQMIQDYENLLQNLHDKFGFSEKQITICTLTPMANVGVFNAKYHVHAQFNNWLRALAQVKGYHLLDLHEEFSLPNLTIDYNCYQPGAKRVSGTIHPIVLWNYTGRQKVMKRILNFDNEQYFKGLKC